MVPLWAQDECMAPTVVTIKQQGRVVPGITNQTLLKVGSKIGFNEAHPELNPVVHPDDQTDIVVDPVPGPEVEALENKTITKL